MINRREFVYFGTAALSLWPLASLAKNNQNSLESALRESALIYLTPVRSNGKESSCQSEVWFVESAGEIYIVTASETWRARAVAKGVNKARIWVGDLGNWKSNDGEYRNLPTLNATANIVTDSRTHEKILGLYGSKYSAEWPSWGPRFKKGLADGSRSMIHYQGNS